MRAVTCPHAFATQSDYYCVPFTGMKKIAACFFNQAAISCFYVIIFYYILNLPQWWNKTAL